MTGISDCLYFENNLIYITTSIFFLKERLIFPLVHQNVPRYALKTINQSVTQMDKNIGICVIFKSGLVRQDKNLQNGQIGLVLLQNLYQASTASRRTSVQMIQIVAMKENVNIHGAAHCVQTVNVQAIDSQGTFTILTQIFA